MTEVEKITAIHESGHGVVGVIERMILAKIDLNRDHDSFGRAHLTTPADCDDSKIEWVLRLCHTAFAGCCSEAKAREIDPRESRKFDDEDWGFVEKYAFARYPNDKKTQAEFVEARLLKTINILNENATWNAILKVADAALGKKDKIIPGDEVKAIIEECRLEPAEQL